MQITEVPKQDSRSLKRHRDDQPSNAVAAPDTETKTKKRKREDVDESNPKVQEYLNIMQNGKETFHVQDDAAQVAAAEEDGPTAPVALDAWLLAEMRRDRVHCRPTNTQTRR